MSVSEGMPLFSKLVLIFWCLELIKSIYVLTKLVCKLFHIKFTTTHVQNSTIVYPLQERNDSKFEKHHKLENASTSHS